MLECVMIGKDHNCIRLVKSVKVAGRRTSLRLERAYWFALIELAERADCTIDDICTAVAASLGKKSRVSLSSALRVFVVNHYRVISLSGPQHLDIEFRINRLAFNVEMQRRVTKHPKRRRRRPSIQPPPALPS